MADSDCVCLVHRSVDGSTPLHVAAAWGDKDTLRLLLHNGADPSLVDQVRQKNLCVLGIGGPSKFRVGSVQMLDRFKCSSYPGQNLALSLLKNNG